MSRIGRRPIDVPGGVTVAIDPGRVSVSGPRGKLEQQVPVRIAIEQAGTQLLVTRPSDRGPDRALHGLTRTLVANMIEGVTNGFERRLELQGVGYRASLGGTTLEILAGYSHPVKIVPRPGIEFEVPAPTQIVVRGNDKQMVGQTAAEIRRVRPPEPYKGKGIRYEGEIVRRKVGKRA
jgi:large subunit ribosomal protein L6